MSPNPVAAAKAARLPAERYTLGQMLIHWSIAALVVWQLVFGGSLPQSMRSARFGGTVDATTAFLADSHIWVGFAILALVIVRLVLRLKRPMPPVHEPGRLIAGLAKTAHNLFYALLFLMPVTGILAYYFGLPTGDIHELGKPAFIGLIAVHVAAALWHQFIRRDGGLMRMLVPARGSTHAAA